MMVEWKLELSEAEAAYLRGDLSAEAEGLEALISLDRDWDKELGEGWRAGMVASLAMIRTILAKLDEPAPAPPPAAAREE